MTKRYVADVLWTGSGHTELVSPGVVDVVDERVAGSGQQEGAPEVPETIVGHVPRLLTPEDVSWGMTQEAAELLFNGVTASVEMYFFPDETATAAQRADLRSVVTPPVTQDADMAQRSIEAPAFSPVGRTDDLIGSVVWGASPADIRGAWIGGLEVVRDGRYQGVDIDKARREVGIGARGLAES